MENKAAEVASKIERLTATREQDIATIKLHIEESTAKANKARAEMDAATREMDAAAYEKANTARQKAEVALEMYNARLGQLYGAEIVSEEESDKTIEELLTYEAALAADYKQAAEKPLLELKTITAAYMDAVEETEQTIKLWERRIHPNYRNPGAIYADGTNRSQRPVPVHVLPYLGCEIAVQTQRFIDGASAMLNHDAAADRDK